MTKHIFLLGAALSVLAAAPAAFADITNNLVVYYSFENVVPAAGATIADQSGHGHNGVCRQDQSTLKTPALVPGPSGLGDALFFDGLFYIQIPNHSDFDLTSNITVAAWISVDTFDQDWQTMFCRGDWSWRLHRSGSSDLGAFHMNGLANGYGVDGATTNLRVPKRWLQLVGTYSNGAGAKLYINGALENSNTSVSGLINTTGDDPVTIGAQIDSGVLRRLWRGQMDEVRLYNRALTAADVSELYSFVIGSSNGRPLITCPSNQERSLALAMMQLTATTSDDGLPLPANPGNPDPSDPNKLRWAWSVVSLPPGSSGVAWSGNPANGEAFTYSGSSNAPGTFFTCNPTATFDVPGTYTLSFSATDGDKTSSQEVTVKVNGDTAYHEQGYQYLSPIPNAEYCSAQTRFVLVRFNNVLLSDVTNLLSTFITVTGANSGSHPGTTRIASDGRTVIFTMSNDFILNELATVSLNPQLREGAGGSVQPLQYRFAVGTHLPDPGVVTARGETPPNGAKENAFDGATGTQWLDAIVPNGTGHYSWIQYLYPATDTHVVNQYAITSAADYPERDPASWNFYGVDQATNLVLLDTQTSQNFTGRGQTRDFSITNGIAFRGFRLEITEVANPATATGVQLAQLEFAEPQGSLLREYWLGIPGTDISDLTNNANFPNTPSASSQIPTFEAPANWANDYGTRIRGYITAPNTGSFVFWISSDDDSELWLSTDATAANKTRIAYVSGWTNPREWSKYAEQRSTPISLVAGQTYYVEALQKEGGGSDNVAVGWAKPGQSTTSPSEVIPGSVLTPWIGGPIPPGVAVGNIGRRPSTSVLPNKPGSKDLAKTLGYPLIMANGVSVPSDFPMINVIVNNNPDADPIFIDNRGGGGKPYNVIFNNDGTPQWYSRYPDERRDMKVQRNGMLTMLARDGGNHFNVLDQHYRLVGSYWAVNGYGVDEHELQVLADGMYFLFGLASETVDMSRYIAGGNASASVTEQVIQGFTPAGDLIFQWRAWDHLDIVGQEQFIDITTSGFDFPHMNSIDVDTDGNLLLSSRNTSEVTKINRDTGEIIWRLGGTHNQFTFVNDPLNGTRNQHAFRVVTTNDYTVFDNGNLHNPSVSRAVEYVLDTSNMMATLVWQYPNPTTPSLYSFYMGDVQRLSNGNTLIDWAVGNLPKLTEVRPDGTKAYEMNWVDGWEAYRTWRCPWQGSALQPYLIVEPFPDNISLIFNQFGDTNVAYYKIYGGTAPQSTNLLETSTVTLKKLTNLQNGSTYYFRVTAVNNQGVEGPYSNEASTPVNIIKPGQNMIANGDFSQGTASWIWTTSGTASATWSVVSGTGVVHIVSAGTALSAIQLRQAGLKLVQGKKYVLQFDAWCSLQRAIETRLAMDQSPFTTYMVQSPTFTQSRQHFTYSFTMQSTTDLNARLMFNMGAALGDIYLDNVSLYSVPPGDLNLDGRVDLLDLKTFTQDWMKQQAGLGGDLDGNGKVDFYDFGILGENWSSP